MAPPYPEDKTAGFTGLVVGAVTLLIALSTIVYLTNAHYARLEGAKAEAPK